MTLHRHVAPLALAIAAVLAAPIASAEADKVAAAKPNPGFELLKALVGEWEMPAREKSPATTLTYTLVSEGTALMETMGVAEKRDAMVTLYHPDGAKVMMTHYCGANNQPRMRCGKPSADNKTLSFAFVDGTNVTSTTGHMHRLILTLEDADHLTQQWVWKQGKTEALEEFHFTRKPKQS